MLLLALTGSIATGKSTTARTLTSAPYNLPLIDADVIAREVVEPGTRAYWQIRREFEKTTPGLILPSEEIFKQEGTKAKGENRKEDDDGRRRKSWTAWILDRFISFFSLTSSSSSSPSPSQLPPINRATLGRRVFGSTPSATRDRQTLNSIVHPAVRLTLLLRILHHYISGTRILVLDIPLLYESSLDIFAGYVLFVAASPEIQKRRLLARDKGLGKEISEEEAEARIRSQVAVVEKVRWTEDRGEGWGGVVWNDGEGEEGFREEIGRVVGSVVESARKGWWGSWLRGSPLGAFLVGMWVMGWNWLRRRRRERGREEGKKER